MLTSMFNCAFANRKFQRTTRSFTMTGRMESTLESFI